MKSLARRIALRFFAIITLLILMVSITVISLHRQSIRIANNSEIKKATSLLIDALLSGTSITAVASKFPAYIVFTMYNQQTQEEVITNDPFIPLLPLTNGKSMRYYEKEFFTDSDLDIIYSTQLVSAHGNNYVVQVGIMRDDEDTHLWKHLLFLYGIILLPLVGISYLSSLAIAKHTLKPIVRITKAAANISSSNLDTMLAVSHHHDELDALAVTFNDLFARIKDDFSAVNAANQAKSAFLSNMSHEIRTPINAILGLDEMILRESTESAIKDYARNIQSSGKSLLSIINDILDFSKIEAGKLKILPVDYDLSVTVSDLVNMIAPRAAKKGLSLHVNVDSTMPHKLHGDETRVKQCILNILTNAVKYTPHGSVTLNISYTRASCSAIKLRAQVIDTGIGIKENDLQKLFSPFERIEESRNRTIEGTGLGMSIVKNLLAAMGTHLEVKSEYGKGSDFAFTVEQGVLDWEPIGNYAETKAKQADSEESYMESFQAPDAHILAIDDTPLNLTVIRGLLKKTHIQIDTAESGFEALEMAKERRYDLLLVDHRMPKMDGIEMLHVLRGDSTSKNQHTVCIALTANAISGAREMYLEAGFEDYLSKPVEAAALEAMLSRYLPKELVLHKGDAGFKEQEADAAEVRTEGTARDNAAIAALWETLFAQDITSALHNCGSVDVFLEAAKNFCETIEGRANVIETYAAQADWKNYTVQVHSLKSCARLIGANKLSALAAELEALGDTAQKEATSAESAPSAPEASASPVPADKANCNTSAATAIAEKTPALLELYKSYRIRLSALSAQNGSAGPNTPKAAPLPPIDDALLSEALSALKEVVSAFDFDSADSIISELEAHALPATFADKFANLKTAVHNADHAAVMSLLA